MPSIFEYWTTMAYSTCNNYLKRYTDVAALKAGIRRHASTNGVQINLEENINDIARFRQGIPRQKRPIAKNISEAPPPKRARIADIRIENAQIEELQAAVVDTPPVVVVDAPPAIAIAVNNDSPVIVVVDAPPTIAINGARKPLVLNGIIIEVDPQTLMVNATQMCRAAGKEFANYSTTIGMIQYLNALESNLGIPRLNLITSNRGGNHSGTMVHRRVALYLAQKLSPLFAVQVTGWLDELRIENDQLLTQLEELQAAVNVAPPTIAVNGAEIIEFVLKLSNGVDFIVPVRCDGYVNVTKICQAAGKRLQNYKDRVDSKHFLDRYVALTGIQANAIFEVFQGGNLANVEQGTFAHPDIAIHIAQWCSADFSIQVSRWVRELRIKNTQLLTQIEELQAAAVIAPPVIVVNDARKPLVLNGITIEVDPQTLMVNATQMCRAAGKLFGNYRRLDSTEEFLQELSSNIHISILDFVKSNQGGNHSGTWVDWRVALHLAQWLSPAVQVQVTGWLGELMLTGRVELGNEMSPQQLDEAWQQRVQEEQARHQQATEALETLHRQATEALETRITTMERQGELAVQKTREELDAAIKTLARDTEQLPQFPDGANVLYAGYIDNGLIKYGQSSNFTRRLAEHRRHYPEFMLIKALPCDNAVASEKKLRDFVAKKRIGGNYNNEKEIVCFETQEDVYKLIRAMQRSCRNKDSAVSVELKRIEADVEIKKMEVDLEIKRIEMDVKKMELLMQAKITFEQYLQMK